MTADLIDTVEMYLRTILELEEEGQVPMRARIAERLDQSGPTVSQTCARMERLGLLIVTDDRHLELTSAGRQEAIAVMRKHRLAERLLADVIGLEWEFIHEEACRWEHVMSDRVEKRILEMLKVKDVSPYGNPIPGLAELGHLEATRVPQVVALADVPVAVAQQGQLVLVRLSEQLQLDSELLAQFAAAGLIPGASIIVEQDADNLILKGSTGVAVPLTRAEAAQFFVAAD